MPVYVCFLSENRVFLSVCFYRSPSISLPHCLILSFSLSLRNSLSLSLSLSLFLFLFCAQVSENRVPAYAIHGKKLHKGSQRIHSVNTERYINQENGQVGCCEISLQLHLNAKNRDHYHNLKNWLCCYHEIKTSLSFCLSVCLSLSLLQLFLHMSPLSLSLVFLYTPSFPSH